MSRWTSCHGANHRFLWIHRNVLTATSREWLKVDVSQTDCIPAGWNSWIIDPCYPNFCSKLNFTWARLGRISSASRRACKDPRRRGNAPSSGHARLRRWPVQACSSESWRFWQFSNISDVQSQCDDANRPTWRKLSLGVETTIQWDVICCDVFLFHPIFMITTGGFEAQWLSIESMKIFSSNAQQVGLHHVVKNGTSSHQLLSNPTFRWAENRMIIPINKFAGRWSPIFQSRSIGPYTESCSKIRSKPQQIGYGSKSLSIPRYW